MSNQRLTAKQTAELLDFSITNLKHYAILLEQNGLSIYRNTRNHREYSQHDVKLLRAIQILNRDKSMLLEDAASLVMSSDTDIDAILASKMTGIVATNDANISVVPQDSVDNERLLLLVTTLQSEIQERDSVQTKFMAAIDDKLIEQQAINVRLLKQNDELLERLEALERKQDEQNKRSLWSRLFSK